MFPTPEAIGLHREHPPIDMHADTLMWTRWFGYDLTARHGRLLPNHAFVGHVDLPKMQEGHMGGQFFGLVSLPFSSRGAGRVVDEQIDALERAAAASEKLRLVRSAADVEIAARHGATAGLLGIEGAHALEGDLERLDHFARRGVRYLGLLHFSANEAGHPAMGYGKDDSVGLTRWGRELVRRCEDLGVLVDLAHINRTGFLEACRLATKPPIVSHTGFSGAYPHWRNIDDEQLRALANKGGIASVIFAPRFLGGPGIDCVVAHLLHVLDVAGEDTPALGSDWDGMIVPTTGLTGPHELWRLTEAMLRARFSTRTIGKILRHNVLRVLRHAE